MKNHNRSVSYADDTGKKKKHKLNASLPLLLTAAGRRGRGMREEGGKRIKKKERAVDDHNQTQNTAGFEGVK